MGMTQLVPAASGSGDGWRWVDLGALVLVAYSGMVSDVAVTAANAATGYRSEQMTLTVPDACPGAYWVSAALSGQQAILWDGNKGRELYYRVTSNASMTVGTCYVHVVGVMTK